MMAFTNALYYPSIEIGDEGWLKNAILYWDRIYTIVPTEIDQPYKSRTASELYNEGILQPLYVDSDSIDGEYMAKYFLEYIESQEGKEVLASGKGNRDDWFINLSKLPIKIREVIERPDQGVIEKSTKIEKEFEEVFIKTDSNWVRMYENLGSYYMTLLATYLSNREGYGLLTDMASNDRLANAVRRDSNLRSVKSVYYRRGGVERNLAQGTLADLILEKLEIDPNTPVEKIIDFRTENKSAIGKFRNQLGKLTEEITKLDMSSRNLRQDVEDIYLNSVVPSIDDLKESLKFNNIIFTSDGLFKVASISVGPTSFASAVLGLAVPQAIIAMAGLSLVTTLVNYNVERENILRNNPYTYVLALEKLK
jgi:hypothetical protein